MPVNFLTPTQRQDYGRYASSPSQDDLARFFHLSDNDQALVRIRKGDHNRLGFALQLTTVRFLGTFMEDQGDVPLTVLQTLGRQLAITDPLSCIQEYGESFLERLGLLVDREITERDSRRLADRLRFAKLKQAACLEDLDLHTPRQLDRSLILKLADCQWVAEHLNILITGPTEYTT